MSRAWVLVVLSTTACGRLEFATVDASTTNDGQTTDVDDVGDVDGATMVTLPPSCAASMPRCGSAAGSCCESRYVSAATYFRSHDLAVDGMYSSMAYPATVDKILLDRYEITVGRFRAFVDAGFGVSTNPPATESGSRTLNGMPGAFEWSSSWSSALPADRASVDTALDCSDQATWTPTAGANEKKALNCINWYEAQAFCIWDGGFLPTEAEWNNAATGGTEQRALPWSVPADSVTIDPTFAVYSTTEVGDVGQRPGGDGRYGHADLAGNVWEWTVENYASPYVGGPCVNCALDDGGASRTVRGGGFQDAVNELRTGVRDAQNADVRFWFIGARCARPI